MKKLILLASLLIFSAGARAASPWIVNQTSATLNVPINFNQPVTFSSSSLASYSMNNAVVRYATMSATVAGATETYAFHDVVYYPGTNASELAAGYWLDFFYNQSGSTGTAHGIGLFVRNHGALSNTNFQAAIEGNTLCTSTQPFAYCVGGIFHTKGDTQANGSAFPITSLFAGVNSRIDITSDGFGTVASPSGFVVHFRPDPGSLGGAPGEKFGYYSTDSDIQILNRGNILKVAVSSAATGGGTLDIRGTCGGQLVLTSTGSIVMSATSFSAASNVTTDGTYNDGCEIQVINANLVSGRTIGFQNSNSGLLTFNSATQTVGALGGSFRVGAIASAGIWDQLTLVTESGK